MEYKLVKLDNFSGNQATVYTLLDLGSNKTLFEDFILENLNSFKSEILDINKRLISIGKKTGAREDFFKTKEGKPGDLVCALYDKPNSKLRLYCIRYGTTLIILGSGGHKPKNIKALQENPKLTKDNNLLVKLSKEIARRLKDKDIEFSNDFMELEGDLEFEL